MLKDKKSQTNKSHRRLAIRNNKNKHNLREERKGEIIIVVFKVWLIFFGL
jgi:hypothetical protein